MKINAKIIFLVLGFVLGIFSASFVYLYLSVNQQTTKAIENAAKPSQLGGSKTLTNYSDLEYLNLMIINHNDALEMSDIALKNSKNINVLKMAKDIIVSETEEISKMKVEMENIINSQ